LLLQVLVAELFERPLLALILNAEIVAKLILNFELDHVVRVQIPRIDRVLAVVVDRDGRYDSGAASVMMRQTT
jgi:hypothetical protein